MENNDLLQAIGELIDKKLEPIKQDILKLQTTLETKTNKNINILVDGHKANTEKLDKLDTIENNTDHIKAQVDVLNAIARTHTEDIQEIKTSVEVLDLLSKKNLNEINKLKRVN